MEEMSTPLDEARRNTRARFEQWASNPKCDANTLSAVHNVRLDKAAASIGLTPSFGQSPFAIARGNTFERGLFTAEAERLRTALVRSDSLPTTESSFIDLRLRMNGGTKVKSVDEALEQTKDWLAAVAVSSGPSPAIVAAPMVRIPRGVILPEALLIIDAVTVTFEAERPVLTVGEIKVFPDRGGHTEPAHLASARAQAGLYKLALEMTIEAAGLADSLDVSPNGFLVFTWPGSNQPSVRANEDLTSQASRALRGFDRLEASAGALVHPDDFEADEPALIQKVLDAPVSYSEACLSFCDLAPRCYRRAQEDENALILGAEAGRMLAEIPLRRAVELMNGQQPTSDREADIQRQLDMS